MKRLWYSQDSTGLEQYSPGDTEGQPVNFRHGLGLALFA